MRFGGWRRGEPIEGSGAGLPDLLALRLADWHGGRGGHVDFSPVLPADGKLAVAQAQKMKKRFDEFGLDYCASFTVGERHVGNINSIVFDRDDADMVKAARSLFETVVADAAQDGYGVYRAPISLSLIHI